VAASAVVQWLGGSSHRTVGVSALGTPAGKETLSGSSSSRARNTQALAGRSWLCKRCHPRGAG